MRQRHKTHSSARSSAGVGISLYLKVLRTLSLCCSICYYSASQVKKAAPIGAIVALAGHPAFIPMPEGRGLSPAVLSTIAKRTLKVGVSAVY